MTERNDILGQKAITINTPASADAHITADDDAFIHHALLGEKSGILGSLTCEKSGDNVVVLRGGGASNRGYVLYVPNGESESLTIVSGTQGLSRHDLVVAQFTRGTSDTADELIFTVVTGTPGTAPEDPQLITSDLLSAGDVNQVALFRITIDGTVLTAVEKLETASGGTSGRSLFVGSAEPAEANEGDLWFVTA